jgi:hypothetical protein
VGNRIHFDFIDDYSKLMDIQLAVLILLFLGTLLRIILKGFKKIRLTHIIYLTIALIIWEISLTFQSPNNSELRVFTSTYDKMSCTELLERFEYDKSQNKFTYFSYGLAFDPKGIYEEFKEKYDVEVFANSNGCIGSPNSHCYNVALLEYLESK